MNKIGKRKLIVIILALLVAIAAIVVVVVLKPFGGKEEKVELQSNQINIGGKAYTFSAENGIDNFSQVEASDGEYISTYTMEVEGIELGYTNFTFYDVETYDGVSQKLREAQAEEKGWRYRGAFVPAGTYYQYYTETGVIDWNAIEAYYNALLDICEYTADECLEADDVAGLEEYGTKHYADSKLYIMSILAHGKLCNQLVNGEIDYFVLAFDMFYGQPAALKAHVYGTADVVKARGFE